MPSLRLEVSNPKNVEQGYLFDLSEIAGYGAMTVRERLFAEGIMQGKNRSEAAEFAGITGNENTVRKAGSRLATKPRVAAVLAQAWRRSGADIEHVVAQASEIITGAAERLRGMPSQKERAQAFREWYGAAALLASIHGKLQLNVNVNDAQNKAVLTPRLMEELMEKRRRIMGRPVIDLVGQQSDEGERVVE